MPSVLDELRDQLRIKRGNYHSLTPPEDYARDRAWGLTDAIVILDTFEAAHPGLVDRTGECSVCGAVVGAYSPSVVRFVDPDWHWSIFDTDHELYDDLYCIHLCPACVKEAS